MKINLPIIYSQFDPRWSNLLLGFNTDSKYNIYHYGCLITCLAMVSRYYGKETDPGLINAELKKVNGFASGGNYVWNSINKIYSNIKETLIVTPSLLTDGEIGQIKAAIDNGYPVMVQLDSNPKTVENDMHFVLIVGYNPTDENDFTILDPLGGKERSLKDYLGWFKPSARKTIEKFAIYTGPKPKLTPEMILVGKDQWDLMRQNHDKWHGLIHYLDEALDPNTTQEQEAKSMIAGYKSRSTDLEKQLIEAKADLTKAWTEIDNQKDKLANVMKNCQIGVDMQKAHYEALIKDMPSVEKLEAQYKGTIWQLQSDLREVQKQNGLKDIEITDLKTRLDLAQKGALKRPLIDFIKDKSIEIFKKILSKITISIFTPKK